MDEKQTITAGISEVAENWALEYFENRRRFFAKKGINASKELTNSFGLEINTNTGAAAVRLLIAFSDQGRYIDMKRIKHDKWGRNAVDRLEKWVVARGLGKFVPGFIRKYDLKAPPRDVLNRIAWGIMVSRGNGKFRRRTWYAKSKTAAISSLFNEVAARVANDSAESLGKAFDFAGYARAKGR